MPNLRPALLPAFPATVLLLRLLSTLFTCSPQGPLAEFVRQLRDTAVEAGRVLGERGCRDLGALVLSLLDAQAAAGQPPSAAALVEKLAEALPGFDDKLECQGKTVGGAGRGEAAHR